MITAAVIVGEKLTTITTSSASIASLRRRWLLGATGSHGHAIQSTTASPAIVKPSVTPVICTMAAKRRPMRSRFRVNPAISAISVVAIPVMT